MIKYLRTYLIDHIFICLFDIVFVYKNMYYSWYQHILDTGPTFITMSAEMFIKGQLLYMYNYVRMYVYQSVLKTFHSLFNYN